MSNRKNLMITMMHWECSDAQILLKLNGIESEKNTVLMAEADCPFHVSGCAKLSVSEENYELGLKILKEHGFDTDNEFMNESLYVELVLTDI